MRMRLALDMDRGKRIDRIAHRSELAQHRPRVLTAQQWTVIPTRNALRQSVEIGIEPNGRGPFEDQCPGFFIHECAATGRDHLGGTVDQAGDYAAFAIAEMCFAKSLKDFGNRQPRRNFDFMISVNKWQAKPHTQSPPDRCFADAHQPNQNNGARCDGV